MTKQTYILAIDAGTTSVKVVLFDCSGHEISSTVNEYELEKPAPDIVEVHPEKYWDATQQGISELLRNSQISVGDIKAISVTSQGETLIVLDENGQPLRNAIVWLDNRSQREADQIAEQFDRWTVYETTGQQEIVPTWTATKILWLRNNEEDTFRRTARFLMVEDYLIYRLTGQFATADSLLPSTLYYDLQHNCWWQAMLDFLDIKTDQLPELYHAGDVVGNLTADIGLNKETKVTTAPIDQIAAAVGSGNIKSGIVTETTGSALAICATLDHPALDPDMRIGLYNHALAGHYIQMPWIPNAGMVLRWFRDNLCANESYAELSQLAEAVPAGSDGLTILPHLCGAFCPDINPAARGVFHGVSMAHTRGHFVRAILESIAYSLRQNIDILNLPDDNTAFYSLGGGSRSPLWVQIKANVLNKAINVPTCSEATCLGSAILAAVGTGIYSSINDAVSNMVHIKSTYHPDEHAAKYNDLYQRFQALNKYYLEGIKNDFQH